ncbi:hypothetical protein QBC37DRAFT_391115 [Rhypophila decipiens]|uniref:Uncharacterized protein n=1 Tax=Rhypophila decipiens TaxID=261697 RepID=A0AAN6XZQ5_9PEZI|nr:hypothetical protein QBC37DRAFT_391115 [Rhypophila decipiens]
MSTEANNSKDSAGHTSPTEAKEEDGSPCKNLLAAQRPTVTAVLHGQPRAYSIQHGDHFDTLTDYTPWTCVFYGGDCFDWFDRWVEVSDSWTIKKMISWRPQVLPYTRKLAGLKREDMIEFANNWILPTPIPLFKDPESGDESLALQSMPDRTQLQVSYFSFKAEVFPPSATQELQPKQERKPPRYAVYIGCLKVRTTTFRGLQLDLESLEEPPPVTEKTDWNVIIDVEDENYPVWIVASRQQLKDHYHDQGEDYEPLFPLPIFWGLMSDESADYDCACILVSIHRLGLDNPMAPDFSEVLDIIRSTRCIIDPVHHPLPPEQLTKYVNNEQFDHPEPAVWPADPDMEVKITHVLVYDDDSQQDLWHSALERGEY